MSEKGFLQDVHHNLWRFCPNSGEIYRKVEHADCGIFFKYAPDKKGSYKLLSYNCLSIEGLYLHVIMSGVVTCNHVKNFAFQAFSALLLKLIIPESAGITSSPGGYLPIPILHVFLFL